MFANIPLKMILHNRSALIFSIIEKRISLTSSSSNRLLNTNNLQSEHKLYKGFTILPITKLFKLQQIKNGLFNTIEQAKLYRPTINFKIEDKYASVMDKGGLKKYYDSQLTNQIDLSFSYTLSTNLESEEFDMKKCKYIRNSHKPLEYFVKNKDLLKRHKDEGRTNDLKINLTSLMLTN